MTDFSDLSVVLQSLILDGISHRISALLNWFYYFDGGDDPKVRRLLPDYCVQFYLAINIYREWYAVFSDDGDIDSWKESCWSDQLDLYPKFYKLGFDLKGGLH